MKKWLVACLLAMALLFVTTAAMAGHNKANDEYCLGGSYGLLKEYENQHLRRCNDCQEELLENHWVAGGSLVEGGKGRIYAYFTADHLFSVVCLSDFTA